MLLTRDKFREEVFKRDNHKCIICGFSDKKFLDAHHILERRLFSDGGYYLDNGATLCPTHHMEAEETILSTQEIRERLNITKPVLPNGFYNDVEYDKWGNVILENGMRLRGELFYDESVQKVLISVCSKFTKYVKYPRTFHLPWSNGTKDDRFLNDDSIFEGKEVVVTEKLDGENTTLYNDYIHARSLEYSSHKSRDYMKSFHAQIGYNIPKTMRVCCENVTAIHSIEYENLEHFCYGFSVWENDKCFNWNDTQEWLSLLDIISVPVLYKGKYNKELIHFIYEKISREREIEGYVIRNSDSFSLKDFNKNIAKYVRENHIKESNHNWKYKKVQYNHF